MPRFNKIDYKAKIKLSYNPDDVNIRLQHFRVYELLSMIDDKLILNEDFQLLDEIEVEKSDIQTYLFQEDEFIDVEGDDGLQRNSNLWNKIQKSQFIESLMIKLPIPLFYFDGSNSPWRIIDGLQRLHTIKDFIAGKFSLVGLEYLADECDGHYFESIPGFLRRRILNSEVIAYVINPGTPPDVKYNIFKRINTGGLKLNGQEIRNAFFRGAPADFTKKLASEPIFKKVTNERDLSRRMIDREFANRFIAFQIFDYKDYNGKMDVFLSNALMELYDKNNSYYKDLEHCFVQSLKDAYEIFGANAFYRPKPDGNWGKQPNKALFDTLSWNLSQLSENKTIKIIHNKSKFRDDYFKFMNENTDMYKSINDTTSSKTSVINRFSLLRSFILEFTT